MSAQRCIRRLKKNISIEVLSIYRNLLLFLAAHDPVDKIWLKSK